MPVAASGLGAADLDELRIGLRLHDQGDHEAAIALYKAVLARHPIHPEVQILLAAAYAGAGRHGDAIAELERTVSAHSQFAKGWSNLGRLLLKSGRFEEAEVAFHRAIAADASLEIRNHIDLARILLRRKSHSEAAAVLKDALRRNPRSLDAYRYLAFACTKEGQWLEAMACYQQMLRLKPGCVETRLGMAVALRETQQYDKAFQIFKAVGRADPERTDCLLEAASAAVQDGQIETAQLVYAELVERLPNRPEPWGGLAHCAAIMGDQQALDEAIAKSLERDPDYIPSWYKRFTQRKATRGDPAFDHLERIFRDIAQGHEQRAMLGYTLGKMYEDIEEYALAFEKYAWANHCQREDDPTMSATFSAADLDRRLSRQKHLFGASSKSPPPPLGTSDPVRPVFILGMPRSGTTLVEQILSRHPIVSTAGELQLLGRLLQSPLGATEPPDLRDRAWLQAVASNYLSALKKDGEGFSFVTDKTPGNFEHIGFIRHLFPTAKIIYCRRNPMDIAASIYTNHFNHHHRYATDLNALGNYLIWHRRLMNFWLAQFGDAIHVVDYEALVMDVEGGTRALASYLDLDWSPAMVSPEQSRRPVQTLSLAQVRRPVHASSVDRWRRFEAGLAGLHDMLRAAHVV